MCEIYLIEVNIFMTPQILDISFATTTLYELAGLERADTEPPVAQHLSDQELQTLLPQPLGLTGPAAQHSRGAAYCQRHHGGRSSLRQPH